MTASASPVATSATSHLLPRTLGANAAITALTGVVAAGGAGVLDTTLGIAAPVLAVLGVGLVAYAALLWRWSRRTPVPVPVARFAIAADAAWVAASVGVLVAAPASLTTAGRWTIGVVALGVADLALAQYVGLRRQER